MGEGKAAVRNRNTDRLVAKIEPGQNPAAFEQRGEVFDAGDVGGYGRFPLTCAGRVFS